MSGIEFLPLIAIALLFWLLVIRPQGRRAKELRGLQSSLELGDAVMLTSGIYGVVRRLDDDHAYVDIAEDPEDEVTVKVVRGAIGLKQPRQLDDDRLDDEQQGRPEDIASEETN